MTTETLEAAIGRTLALIEPSDPRDIDADQVAMLHSLVSKATRHLLHVELFKYAVAMADLLGDLACYEMDITFEGNYDDQGGTDMSAYVRVESDLPENAEAGVNQPIDEDHISDAFTGNFDLNQLFENVDQTFLVKRELVDKFRVDRDVTAFFKAAAADSERAPQWSGWAHSLGS